jgi:hypothetical protein
MFLNHEPSLKTDRIRPPHPKASNSVVNLNLIFYIALYLFKCASTVLLCIKVFIGEVIQLNFL